MVRRRKESLARTDEKGHTICDPFVDQGIIEKAQQIEQEVEEERQQKEKREQEQQIEEQRRLKEEREQKEREEQKDREEKYGRVEVFFPFVFSLIRLSLLPRLCLCPP